MPSVSLRAYQPSDLSRCRDLWLELTQRHRDIYDDQSIGGEDVGMYFDKHLELVGPERIWVAEEDGDILGFVGLILEGESAEVEPIVVTVDRRSEGVGSALLDRAVTEARSLGVRILSLRPVARNREAIAFFHRAGFRTLGHLQLFQYLKDSGAHEGKRGPELFGLDFQV